MKIIIYFFLLFLTFHVNAITLTNQLNNFLKKEYPFKKDIISIIIRTPLKKNIYCEKPVFSILNNINYIGLKDVLLTCIKKHYYLKIEIHAKGEYIVANRNIPRGTKIKESDLKVLIGRIDLLPSYTYRRKQDVINRVNLRDILPFQVITSLITRPFWIVKIHQQVTVIIHSNNFTIFSKAKSLSNGSENDTIRIKTKTGKIITGTINKSGEVIVFL
ncbi:flagellar basal body P-ring formation protein FlgA [Buchnera aphidicola (Artemisaphis artemisicola)]|uniref:Flagella basal body P-ring formation protein FlgA n=1 Tax=Buchnera aphidicola (Artemisaphis artemisicola) TaxID=1241836 RepID=A0A4D6XM22_9GAMM|nr:flagellar basal body P-ring formation protein FlgA [Buchnera aphidicola (Artemisaphis artemisicola)]